MYGWGLRFEDGDLDVRSSLFDSNSSVGIALLGSGAVGWIRNTVISNTSHAPAFHAAAGLELAGGAQCLVEGSLLVGNSQGGIVVGEDGSQAWVAGSLLLNSQPGVDEVDGTGISVTEGGMASVDWTLVAGNATSGVQVFHHGSVIELDRSAVLATAPGGSWVEDNNRWTLMVAGDGILVADDGSAAVSRSTIAGSHRCGVYFADGSGGLETTVVHTNSAFGLALANSDVPVTWEDLGNYFFDNGLEIRGPGDWNVTTSPQGLAVPNPPLVAAPPPLE